MDEEEYKKATAEVNQIYQDFENELQTIVDEYNNEINSILRKHDERKIKERIKKVREKINNTQNE